ncbi:proprotein convertase P-domain-containing protein [Teichococcus cervicalis]|uniref:Type I secretion target GGXGXDXXX repeat (2 copies) n=1 Tax=Pseudoroseomonas cervicalis ATCC 49957 TaxID=525371 RepID=D5RMV9_9PROT|nr:proprotein convertase P-domain-containing protein [Pseudoroseomonas cervicalis]EFH11360.1 type I secretion target GGXGXDXXX repeat (2 copies) [Pseudoroseomonas cervicalis ATCC 49957]
MASFNDPLFPGQWQLRPGTGINATPLYDEYSGRGVRIGLVDTPPPNPGLAELQGQIDWAASRVATGHNPADDGDLHGQSVALVLAARAGNGTGGIGAAFGATLVSYGFDSRAHRTVAQEAEMLAFQKEVDISQNSWSRSGESFRDDFSRDEYAAAAMAEAAAVGRGGLGTIFVRSAGNNGGTGDDVNTHSYSNNRWTVLVGATDAQGKVQGFSNPGAALLVVAPATATSYAAPLASATIALMLEANPALGYRDVQSILALSARMTDDGAGWAYNGAAGWNGGGLHVSRRAGFGLIDAQAAVRLAESWRAQSTVANLLSAEAAGEGGLDLPEQGRASQSARIDAALLVERAELTLALEHARLGDLRITLVSPSGTASVLLQRLGLGAYTLADGTLRFTLSSTHFLGEAAAGEWRLVIEDAAPGNGGRLLGWSLQLFGAAPGQDSEHIFTNEYAALAAAMPERQVLRDEAGEDRINAAAVSGPVRIDLSGATESRIAGQRLVIAEGTVIEHALGGDGDDWLGGNAADNHLIGNRGSDTLRGLEGNDILEGGAGDDLLIGDAGDDVLEGGPGADRMLGGAGDDLYRVDDPRDAVIEQEGEGYDTVRASIDYALPAHVERLELLPGARIGAGNALGNVIIGHDGGVRLLGLAGDDVLRGGAGDDVLEGGEGQDRLEGGAGDDRLLGGAGNDLLLGGEGRDWLEGGGGGDRLEGGAGDDHLFGQEGDDILLGGGGRDRLNGGGGADWMEGGAGDDVYWVDHPGDRVVERAGEGHDRVVASIDYTLPEHVEELLLEGLARRGTGNALGNLIDGNALDNWLQGGAGDDWLEGGGGDDRLEGGHGNDFLKGGSGADVMLGGFGNDTYSVNDPRDIVVEHIHQGFDTVRSWIEDYALPDWVEVLELWGHVARNGTGNASHNRITGNALDNRLAGGAGNDMLYGMAGDDWLEGGEGDDWLIGGSGHDVLDGGAGFDRMHGGPGNDIYWLRDPRDRILEFEGNGYDTVFAFVDTQLPAHVEALVLLGEAPLKGTGNRLDNRIIGHDAGSRLWGMGGDDVLIGGAGQDQLRGGEGDDWLEGGAGDDELAGGAGADRFVFGRHFGQDRLLDFNPEEGDRLLLQGWSQAEWAAALAGAQGQGGGLLLDLGEGTLWLRGFEAAWLGRDLALFG